MTETKTYAWGTMAEMFGPRHEHRLGMILAETASIPQGTLVLEAAIGLGQLAVRLRDQKLRVFGIDGSFEAALHVRRTTAVPVVVGDLTRMPFRTGAFGAVTSGETLEHLDDDASAVSEISRVLEPAGRCVVTVPACESLRTESDTYYEHRRRYSRDGLTSLFNARGFRIRKATYWGFPIVLIYDTLFILPMNLRRRKQAISDDPALRSVARAGRSRFLVSAVKAIFSLDRIFSFVPYGPGLLMVGEKKAIEK